MLMVKKFGGTSVANEERIFNVVTRCLEDYEKGNEIILILSAMGKYTDELVELANDINPNMPKREMDMLFTVGEQVSVSLMAMAFAKLGIPSISLNAFQVRMLTDDNYGDAKILKIETERIKKELAEKKIVIITGFQGIDENNNYTTLGRGGSDTTAVAVAGAINADSCEIYTDVEGVYTADPRIVKDAIKLKEISYESMLEYSNLGAGVLHNKSVEIAKENNIKLIVRSSLSKEAGTIITKNCNSLYKVTGITSNENVISIIGLNLDINIEEKVKNALEIKGVKIVSMKKHDMSLSIMVVANDVNRCINILHDLFFSKYLRRKIV